MAITNWAPIAGLWSFENGRAVYRRPQIEDQQAPLPFGICVSSVRFSEGKARVTIRLPKDGDGITADTSAYLLLGYRSPRDKYLGVGLAGYHSAYTLTQFDPAVGWVAIAYAGSKENLDGEHSYDVTVGVRGQAVTLEVGGIPVLEHVLDTPLPNGQLGLLAWGRNQVEFADTSVSEEPGKVFVVMQFSAPYEELYTDVIKQTAEAFGLQAYRADEVFRPGIVLEDIISGIVEAKIVIAEITERNPNVFYELGYAHALKKPTILLAESGKALPFDVSGYRCLFYANSIGGERKVEESLRKHLEAILHE
jgi:hypothetical protein